MTAESTVPPPAGQAPGRAGRPVPVLPPRAAADSRPPARRFPARPPSPLPLLVADTAAALAGALAPAGRGPLLAVPLVALSLLLRPRRASRVPGVLDELPVLCGRIAVVWLALGALVAACAPPYALSARDLLLGWAAQCAAGVVCRAAVYRRRRLDLLRRPRAALVIGPAATARRVAAGVLRHPRHGIRPVAIVADDPDGAAGLPVLTTGEDIERALVRHGVREVLAVHPSVRTGQGPLLRALAASGCTVWEVDADSPSYGSPDRLAGFPCRRLDMGSEWRDDFGKRVLDVAVSGALLLAAGPLLLVCAVLLRVTEGPGVVFRQERIGRHGRPFTLLKFRTHRPVDAHEAATRWSVADDRQMSWFCRFLRRTSLDELLQLWNVCRGDMSLVGPRPERPYFVTRFSRTYPGYAARHRMPVGITGLAQVHGLRGDTSIEDRARFDNAYIDDWSLWQDVCILLRTVAALVRPTGS
ncbi:exopolysaccharide biosynthesis polyprenyl glycosylphosphotransferase [Streptomyces sp. NPDC085946]|uniref:exopolysaccharide biosynthesis polyprenyl glycosylphosphotransferase n=1 Tax=Streptomyces sp. NPDC085946 TaxID=3365744 RepID=UPI0037D0CE45